MSLTCNILCIALDASMRHTERRQIFITNLLNVLFSSRGDIRVSRICNVRIKYSQHSLGTYIFASLSKCMSRLLYLSRNVFFQYFFILFLIIFTFVFVLT